MRKVILTVGAFVVFGLGWFAKIIYDLYSYNKPISQTSKKTLQKPFDKYTFDSLSRIGVKKGKFEMDIQLAKTNEYVSYLFRFHFNPNLDGKEIKETEGQINLPSSVDENTYPVVLLFRGYINQETYKVGDGTRNAAGFFAKNGFITLAPDFLGYGGSDEEAGNIFESRFQTYVTAISLVKSLDQIPQWDQKNVFIWGHSNGGQIALTTLEITGVNYPTTLWAPVSKPFPYSVLYYTDDSIDRGKLIRSELAKFEEVYDVEAYSLTNYLETIEAPLLVHQGKSDDAIPLDWTNNLVQKLEDKGKNVTYYTYPATDHNMRPSWDMVIARDLEFFKKHSR